MNSKQFNQQHTQWIDSFVETNDRGPSNYPEFIQFVMDELVDQGLI